MGRRARHLRVGNLDGRHGRVEIVVPDAPVRLHTWMRIGTGYNLGRRPGARWYTGVALRWPGKDDSGAAWFGDVLAPLGRRGSPVELALGGQVGFGRMYHESIGAMGGFESWRLTAGLRYSFGR